MSEEKQAFEGGATRTVQEERYDLVPFAAVRALARRLAMGAKKHGERNWEKGGVEFEKATLSHGIAHLLQYAQTGQQDDLDGALCNLAFLCHFREKATGSGGFTPTRNGILAGVAPVFFERSAGGPLNLGRFVGDRVDDTHDASLPCGASPHVEHRFTNRMCQLAHGHSGMHQDQHRLAWWGNERPTLLRSGETPDDLVFSVTRVVEARRPMPARRADDLRVTEVADGAAK